MAGSSSSSTASTAAASTWEEAEGEFYSEAFLNRDGAGGGGGNSRTSTLDNSYSAHYDSGSMDTVIHRPPLPLDGISSSSSRILAVAAAKNRSKQRTSTTGSAKARSARMKAAVQGLEEEDSEEGEAAEENDEYWLFGKSDKGGGGGGGGGGGNDIFLTENVTTPIDAWRNALRLRDAHLPLKCKRRIRKQCQKQPVLKQGHFHLLWWRMLMLGHRLQNYLVRLKRWSASILLRPPDLLERRRGRAVAELAYLRKKSAIFCLLLFVASCMPSLFLGCCPPPLLACTVKNFKVKAVGADPALSPRAPPSTGPGAPQDQLPESKERPPDIKSPNSTISAGSFELSFLLEPRSFVFAPFRELEKFLAKEIGLGAGGGVESSAALLIACNIIMLLWQIYRFVVLLQRRRFALDAASVFREAFSKVFTTSLSREAAAKEHHEERSYNNLKSRLRLGWDRKWSLNEAASAVWTSLLLVLLLVALIYVALVSEQHSPHRGFLRSVSGGAAAADAYYLLSALLYLLVRYLAPAVLLATQRCRCSQPSCSGCVKKGAADAASPDQSVACSYALPECRANLHATRGLLSSLVFYLTLTLSLSGEFPNRWRQALAMHLYAHLAADLLVLLPSQLLYLLLSCCCCRASRRPPSPCASFLRSFHPGDALSAHSAPVHAVADVLVFLACVALSPALALLCLIRMVLCYLLFLAAGLVCHPGAADADGDSFSANNVRFLDSCFSVILLPLASLLQLCILLPDLLACDLLPLPAETAKARQPLTLLPEDLGTFLLDRPMILALTLVAAVGAFLLLRSSVSKHRLDQECRHLRRHLEDINQDKHYQVMKQRQWYPLCRCHESRLNKTNRTSGSRGSSSAVSTTPPSQRPQQTQPEQRQHEQQQQQIQPKMNRKRSSSGNVTERKRPSENA